MSSLVAGVSTFKSVLADHLRQLDRFATRRGAAKLKGVYDQAQADVIRRLEALGRGSSTFTAHHLRMMAIQIRQGQMRMAAKLADELGDLTKEVQVESLNTLIKSVVKLEKHFTGAAPELPIEEVARFKGVIDKKKTSLMRMHRTSMSHYGARMVGKMENQLAVSLASGETLDGAVGRVHEVAGGEFWQCARIARTECSWAWNMTHRDGIVEVAKSVSGLWQRWTELVSDDGSPLDNRVGIDSMALHGEVCRPGAMFTCPSTTRDGQLVPKGLAGLKFEAPPSRPNDRAVIVPWKPDWGIPGWELKGGQRVPVTR